MKQSKMLIKGMAAVLLAFVIVTGAAITSCDNGTQELNMIKTAAPKVAIAELPGYGFKLSWELDVGVAFYQVWRAQGTHPAQMLAQSGLGGSHIYHNIYTEDGFLVCYDVVDLDADGNPTLEAGVDYEYTVLAVPIMDYAQDTASWSRKMRPRTIVDEMDASGLAATVRLDGLKREFAVSITPPSNPIPVPLAASSSSSIEVKLYKEKVEGTGLTIGILTYKDFFNPEKFSLTSNWSYGTWDPDAEDDYFVVAEYKGIKGNGNDYFDDTAKVTATTSYELLFDGMTGGMVYDMEDFILKPGATPPYTSSDYGDSAIYDLPYKFPSNDGNEVDSYYVRINLSGITTKDDVTYTMERIERSASNGAWEKVELSWRDDEHGFRPFYIDGLDTSRDYGFLNDDVFDIGLPVKEAAYEYRVKAVKGAFVDYRGVITSRVTRPNDDWVEVKFEIDPGILVEVAEVREPTTGENSLYPDGFITVTVTPKFGEGFYRNFLSEGDRIEVYWFRGEEPRTEYEKGELISLLNEDQKLVFDFEEIGEGVSNTPISKALTEGVFTGPVREVNAGGDPINATKERLYLIAYFIKSNGIVTYLDQLDGTARNVHSGIGSADPVLERTGGTPGYLDYSMLEVKSFYRAFGYAPVN